MFLSLQCFILCFISVVKYYNKGIGLIIFTVLQDSQREAAVLCVAEKGPLILVDFPGQALYLQMDVTKETMAWQNVIRAAAIDNGLHLAQQQLTREEIPVIIDKCINFVYAHGRFYVLLKFKNYLSAV